MRRLPFLAVLLLAALPVLGKSLYWRSIDVTARLDRDGRMHVVERQAIVFDGDWNGGERTFHVGTGQTLNFESLVRVDDGGEHKLTATDLSGVDQYQFTEPTVLRWRSRMPNDPPFENKEITYVLKYSIDGVLRLTDGVYYLEHDFAFPDRAGSINNFSLRFDLDPVWRGTQSPVIRRHRGLVPGEGVVVPLTLEFAAEGAPATAVRTLSTRTEPVILALFFLGLGYLFFEFFRAEVATGRFARVLSPRDMDEKWIEQNLLVMPPEVAGAAYDGDIGAPEVAAVLARMTKEGTISSRVETRRNLLFMRDVLCLELLADRGSPSGSDGALIRALFFDGESTDTDKIRKRYSRTGFNPAGIIGGTIDSQLQSLPSWGKKPRRADFKLDAKILGATFILLIAAAFTGGNNTGIAIFLTFAGLILGLFAGFAAHTHSRAITSLVPRFALPLLVLSPLLWLAFRYTRRTVELTLNILTPIAVCALVLAIVKLTLDMLRIPEAPEKIAFRKKLLAARKYFIAELRSPRPRLRDEWYPYFLAFGLGNHVDGWFGAHGVDDARHARRSTGSSSSGDSFSSSSSSASFSGGGGAFGGAGASGGWAIAAAGLAAGVSSPSSGGSGGSSSSSSSSSSGGGGGGGW